MAAQHISPFLFPINEYEQGGHNKSKFFQLVGFCEGALGGRNHVIDSCNFVVLGIMALCRGLHAVVLGSYPAPQKRFPALSSNQ